MQKSYFREEQRFTQPWIWVILVLALGTVIVPLVAGLYVELVEGRPYGNNPTSSDTLLIMLFVVIFVSIGFIALYWKTKLITEIFESHIEVRFQPFFFKPKIFLSDSIAKYSVRQYKPIREYGGWGIKHGLKSSGKAYNVKGNQGLQLIFKNGHGLLIGTQRNDAILRAMNKMMKEESNA